MVSSWPHLQARGAFTFEAELPEGDTMDDACYADESYDTGASLLPEGPETDALHLPEAWAPRPPTQLLTPDFSDWSSFCAATVRPSCCHSVTASCFHHEQP